MTLTRIILAAVLVGAVMVVSLPQLSFAQVTVGREAGQKAATDAGLTETGDLKGIIIKIINFVLGLTGVLGVLFLIIAGFIYITALGNESKAATAKRMVLYVVVGLILVILSAAIVNLVLTTL